MRIAVWRTGHDIANTVGRYVLDGVGGILWHTQEENYLRHVEEYDLHIAYGILRGTADVFRECDRQGKPWIHLDRGYFGANHFDGTYRISLRGTQQTSNWPEPSAHNVELKPWRGFDHSKPVLVVPPTEAVCNFFGKSYLSGINWAIDQKNSVIRYKGDKTPLVFNDYNYVDTFNSSLGWQAIAAGIPCVSDPTHSIVGSFYRNISLDQLAEAQYLDRERLFGTMSSLQMTLQEIEQGKLWPLIQFMLASTPANPSPATSAPTPSAKEPAPNPTSNT